MRYLVVGILLLSCLLLFWWAIQQQTRYVTPSELLAMLASIEEAASVHGVDAAVDVKLEEARRGVQSARRSVVDSRARSSQGSRQADPELRRVEDLLDESIRQLQADRLRSVFAAKETISRITYLRQKIGSPSDIDRLIGVTVKDLLVAFAWPIAALSAVLFLFLSDIASKRLSKFVGMLKSLELGQMRFVFANETKQTAEAELTLFREQVKTEFDRQVQRFRIERLVRDVVDVVITPQVTRYVADNKTVDLRATVHLPDALFEDSLYQLIDYVPNAQGRGRSWSIRYGMMGRQWRLEESACNNKISLDPKQLVNDWGMTIREAGRAPERQSVLCVILKEQDKPVGILYADCSSPGAFGDTTDNLIARVEKKCTENGLTANLGTITRDLAEKGPLIRIYG